MEDFDAKLARQKAEDEAAAKERDAKKKAENKAAPHLTNLAEDQQISQKTYYGMKEFPVRVGRADDQPVPQIPLGALTVQSNHCQFNLLPSGLIELEVSQNKEALRSTYINALLLPKGGK